MEKLNKSFLIDIDPEKIRRPVPTTSVRKDTTPVLDPSKLDTIELTELDYRKIKEKARPNTTFWDKTKVGRFLSGRSKAGRVVRRVGLTALGIGGGLVGLDIDGGAIGREIGNLMVDDSLLQALELIKEILIIIGAIITGGTKTVDLIEDYEEKADELENEGIELFGRKLKHSIKRSKK